MYNQAIQILTKQLFPDARAFDMPDAGIMDKLVSAIVSREAETYSDELGLLDTILADNDNFSAADATIWERRLGIATNSSTDLDDRKLAINRKYGHPGTIAPRQSYRYLQDQLNKAGFDVTVYENRFDDGGGGLETRTPESILGLVVSGTAQHEDVVEHGTIEFGGTFKNKIANHIDEGLDSGFVVGTTYVNTFFIAGATVSTYVDVPLVRKTEFRQLILRVKPAHSVGYLFVNYV